MKKLSVTTVIMCFLTFSACSKDAEETPDPCAACTFPKECIDGRCVDPCDLVNCGDLDCKNGDCVCPTGFEGSNCNQEKIPEQVIVTEIRILDFAMTRTDGSEWDAGQSDGTGPKPDIYPLPESDLAEGNNPYRGSAKIDAGSDSVYVFDLRNSQVWTIDITDPEEITGFGLWDRDNSEEEDEYFFNPMGFLPYEPGRPGFPNSDTLLLENTERGSKAEVIVQYVF